MKKIIANKKTLIAAEAVLALFVILSMLFCFSYYTWSGEAYKTFGFEFLGVFITDYGVFEVFLLMSVVFSGVIVIVSILRLFNIKPLCSKRVTFALTSVSVLLLICSIIAFTYTAGYIMITAIDACGTSEVYRGAGSYMHLIFSSFIFAILIVEMLTVLRRDKKEIGINEKL